MKINFNFEEKNVKLGLENQFTIQEFLEVTPVKILMLKGEKGDTVSAEWGTITGDIEDQTDLKNALDSKANTTDIPDVSDFITKDVDNLTNYTKTSDLSAVATSGDYDDLDNKPTIPSKTSDLTNDSGYIDNTVDNLTNYTKTSNLSTVATSGSYSDLSNKPTIPSKTSDLTNDSNFAVTNADNKFTTGQTIAGETVVDSIRSKNMFDPANLRTGYYKVADGTYDSSISYKCTSYKIEVDNTKEYVLTTGSTQSATMYVMYYDANETYLGYGSTPITQQLSLHTSQYWVNTKYVNFRFDVNNVGNIQLETGDTATAFSSYQNLTGEENYSTEEQVIGTYLEKPLYRKVVEATLSTVNTWMYLNLNNNIDRPVNIYGYYIPTNYSQNRYSILRSTNDFLVQTSENGKLAVKTSDSNALTKWTIVLEYTKTTD